MANNTYKLVLSIDPQELRGMFLGERGKREKQQKNIFEKFFGGGGGQNPMKGLMKLGIISTGVLGLYELVKKISSIVVDASPILQSVLKILHTGIMFMLRPMGDFFAFFLRPIVIYFLRYVAIPFYKYWAPIARSLGAIGGQTIVGWLEFLGKNKTGSTAGGIAGAGIGAVKGAIAGAALGSIVPGFGTIVGGAIGAIVGAITGGLIGVNVGAIIEDFITTHLGNIDLVGMFTSAFDFIVNGFKDYGKIVVGMFTSAFDAIINGFKGYGKIVAIAGLKIRNVWNTILDAIRTVFQYAEGIKNFFGSILNTTFLTNLLPTFAGIVGVFVSMNKEITDILRPKWNDFVKFMSDIAKEVEAILRKINPLNWIDDIFSNDKEKSINPIQQTPTNIQQPLNLNLFVDGVFQGGEQFITDRTKDIEKHIYPWLSTAGQVG